MRRKLNLKALIILTVTVALLGTGGYFLHQRQVRGNAKALSDQASIAKRNDDIHKEINYLRQYLGFVPTDNEALARYGMLLADDRIATTPQAKFKAIKVLDQALNRDPSLVEERRRVVTLAMQIGLFKEALEHLNKPQLATMPVAERHGLIGNCEENLGRLLKARLAYEEAIKHPDAELETYVRLAALLLREPKAVLKPHTKSEEPEEKLADLPQLADDAITRMVKANKTHPKRDYKAYLERARYCRTFGRVPTVAPKDLAKGDVFPAGTTLLRAVEADVEKARELGKDVPEVLLALADLARARRNPELARSYLENGLIKYEKEAKLYLALAELEVLSGRLTAAATCLNKGLEHLPEQIDLLWALADVQVRRKASNEEMDAAITRLTKAGLGTAETGTLSGRLHVANQNWPEAAKALSMSLQGLIGQLSRNRNPFTLSLGREAGLMLGECYERLGEPDAAYGAYNRVLESIDSQSVAAKVGMARARQNAGRLDDALREYEGLIGMPGAPDQAWVERARLSLQRTLNRTERNWAEVDHYLSVAEQRRLTVDVVMLRLEAFSQQEKVAEAEAYLDGLILRLVVPPELLSPSWTVVARPLTVRLPLFWYVAKAALSQGDLERGLEILKRGKEAHGESVHLRLGRIRIWARQPVEMARIPLDELEREATAAATPPAERRSLLMALAAAQFAHKNEVGATRLWNRVGREWKDDLTSRLALFDLALMGRNEAEMNRLIAEVKRIEGDQGALWKYATVRQLIARANDLKTDRTALLTEAKKMLQQVKARRQEWSRVALAEAQIFDLEGQPAKALDSYRKAIEDHGERGTATLRRAFELAFALGQSTEAFRLLKLLPKGSLTGDLGVAAAELSLGTRNAGDALVLAEKEALGSTDPRKLLWLGSMYWRVGKQDDAEKQMRLATKHGKDRPETWEALIVLLAGNDQKAEAKAELAEAEKHLKGKESLLTLALCYEVTGAAVKAETYYTRALVERPKDAAVLAAVAKYHLRNGRLGAAKGPLEDLKRDFRTTAPRESAWARNTLIIAAALGGNYKESQDALAGLGDQRGLPRNATPEQVSAQRARAVILSSQQGRRNRADAIFLLQNLVNEKKHTHADRFNLAALYERKGDWASAAAQLRALETELGAGAATALVPYIRGLLKQNDVTAAREALPRLVLVAKNLFVTKELTARILAKEGKPEEAAKLLREALAADAPVSDVLQAAAAFEDMGRKDDAEKLFTRYVASQKDRPRVIEVLIGFYARQKDVKKGLAQCEKAWQILKPAEAAEACLMLLSEMQDNAEVLKALDGQFAKARAANPTLTALGTATGHLRILQGRHGEAEKLYEAALKVAPRDVVTKNNLAWLLAVQKDKAKRGLQLTEEAIRQVGPHSWLLDTQAVAYLTLGDGDKAAVLMEEVVAEAPSPTASFHLAQAYYLTKDNKAKLLLRSAIEEGVERVLHPLERPALEKLKKELGVK